MGFPAPEECVAAAETRLRVKLLAEHRARLLRNNGGEVVCEDEEWQLHPVWDDTDRRTIARTTGHIVHETLEALRRDSFPRDAVVIATDNSGNHLIVRSGHTHVERWDHETGECTPVEVSWS